jgi:hypothetical protein
MQSARLQKLWVIFFASIAVASFIGGTVHGFYPDESAWDYYLLWRSTLLAVGITAATAWVLAGLLICGPHKFKAWGLFVLISFVLYAIIVIFYSQSFTVVILNYLPAMIALLVAAIIGYRKNHSKYFVFIAAGVLISFVAAFIQQQGIAIHPDYFNHNSTYHLLQAFGLWTLFIGSRGLLILEGAVEG